MTIQNHRMIVKGQKQLRCGYTTGTCAAAAARAAAMRLLLGESCPTVSLTLPDGENAMLEVSEIHLEDQRVRCGIMKDAGDDPDITQGLIIFATVARCDVPGIHIAGGEGVGRVTKPGLDQPVGAWAINSVPRQMIQKAVSEVMEKCHYDKGLTVTIAIPGGKEKAAKTLNPALGIQGGLSILGTTGIVEPMSEQALIDTIAVEIRMHRAQGEDVLLLTPGNYGLDFLQSHYHIHKNQSIKISNYIGSSIDLAVCEGVKSAVLVGHIGKLIKLAGGIMNTHSHEADARMEILTAYAAVAGADTLLLQALMQAVTTDAGLDLLKNAGLLEKVMALIIERIQYHLSKRAGEMMTIDVILFSNVYGVLGRTKHAEEKIRMLMREDDWTEKNV